MFDFSALTTHQQEAVTRKDRPAFIMAGAGTGKTYTLSKRVAYQMSEGTQPLSPEKLMAITFTEAAAAELLDRARSQAKSAGAEYADHMESAWISTIHSMCRRMLSENALDAGIDPGLVVLSDLQASQLLSASVEEAIEQADRTNVRRCFDLLGSYNDLTSVVSALMNVAARTPGGIEAIDFGTSVSAGETAAIRFFKEVLGECVEIYIATLSKKKGDVAAGVAADLESITQVQNLLDTGKPQEAVEVLYLKSRCKELTEAKNKANNAGATLRATLIMKDSLDLVGFVKSVAKHAEKLFAAKIDALDSLTFDTLLSRCHQLLLSDDLSAAYSKRFDSVMVDEFQDTDAIQCSIVERLCQDERGLGKLIVVGDRQQSIYGFRGAEVSVSDDMQVKMEGFDNNAVVPLDMNFRSNPDILAFVEDVFSDERFFGDAFLNLEPAPKNGAFALAHDKKPVVELLVTKTKTRTQQAKNALHAEASAIAKRFVEIKESEPEMSYDDMALILRGFGNVDTYIEAFREQGIPCAITGGRRFYSFGEVSAFCDIVRVLLEPDDNAMLFRVLAGELFSVDDEDLAKLKTMYNNVCDLTDEDVSLMSLCDQVSVPDNIASIVQMLACARQALENHSLSSVLDGVFSAAMCSENMALDALSASGKIANMHKMIDLVRELATLYGMDWRGAARELIGAADSASDFGGRDNSQAPGRTIGRGQPGCVSIMTIHASKGLEYDVVAVSHVESGKSDSKRVMSFMTKDNNERHMAVAVDLWKQAGNIKFPENVPKEDRGYAGFLADGFEQTSEDEHAEKRRLAYVALTRAKKKLIWSAGLTETSKGGIGKTEKIFQDAVTAVAGAPIAEIPYGIITAPSGTLISYEPIEVSDAIPDIPREQISEHIPCSDFTQEEFKRDVSVAETVKRKTFSADYADKFLNEATQELLRGTSQSGESEKAGSGHQDATAFGDLFHASARTMTVTHHKVDGATIRTAALQRNLPEDEISTLTCLADKFFDEFLEPLLGDRTCSVSPEYPVGYMLDDEFVAGSIDLLIERENTREIIDYKTGLCGRDHEYVAKHYGYQALIYAAAILEQPEVEAVQATFVLVEDGMRKIEMPVWTKDQLVQIRTALKE